MKSTKAVEIFGEFLIKNFWDRAIDHHRLMERAHWKAPDLQVLQTKLSAAPDEVKDLVRGCIHEALLSGTHDLLFALQEMHDCGEKIAVTVDGENIAAGSDGLQGELFGEDGWIAKFSAFSENWPTQGFDQTS